MSEPTIWFNPSCSKCRTVQGILGERGVKATYVDYLRHTPTRVELQRVLTLMGAEAARVIARTEEPLWAELGLDLVSNDEILDAMLEHPILIERPIVIVDGHAIVARPPERVLELLEPSSSPIIATPGASRP